MRPPSLALLLMVVGPHVAAADTVTASFASAVLGAGTEGAAYQVGASLALDNWLLTARHGLTVPLSFERTTCPCPHSTDSALLVGRLWPTKRGYASLAVGVGRAYRERRGRQLEHGFGMLPGADYEAIEIRGRSLAFDVRIAPSGARRRRATVGFAAFGNLAPRTRYVGIGVAVHIGKVPAPPLTQGASRKVGAPVGPGRH